MHQPLQGARCQTDDERGRLSRAAASSGMSVSDILRTGGVAEARRLLRAARETKE